MSHEIFFCWVGSNSTLHLLLALCPILEPIVAHESKHLPIPGLNTSINVGKWENTWFLFSSSMQVQHKCEESGSFRLHRVWRRPDNFPVNFIHFLSSGWQQRRAVVPHVCICYGYCRRGNLNVHFSRWDVIKQQDLHGWTAIKCILLAGLVQQPHPVLEEFVQSFHLVDSTWLLQRRFAGSPVHFWACTQQPTGLQDFACLVFKHLYWVHF